MSDLPETKYAKTPDGLHIAYQVFGDGPIDVAYVPGFASHLDLMWENPATLYGLRRLSSYARVILHDKRGTGLSDRDTRPGTLEERMEDLRTVLDTVGSKRPALFGVSEGGPMSILFAATYPERTRALVVSGSFARLLRAPDYPVGMPAEVLEGRIESYEAKWGTGDAMLDFFPPAMRQDSFRQYMARVERLSASPGAVVALLRMEGEIDVRSVLEAITAPTLVLHIARDRVVRVGHGRYLADHIPGAKYVEFDADGHAPMGDVAKAFGDEIEEFLTGARPAAHIDRALATVLFTDIVSSTAEVSRLGDARWTDLLDQHDAVVARELERHRGRKVNPTGDGILATFDGPARAVKCAQAIIDAVRPLGIEIRAGLHTGEVELRGDDIGGIAVHIGQRVSALAGPGEVLVSRTVTDLVAGSGLEFEERGEHELKGLPGKWAIFAVRS